MSAPSDPSRYPDAIQQIRATLWDQTLTRLGPDGALRPPLTDWEFAARYLKGSAFPLEGPSRWFEPAPIHLELAALAEQHMRLLVQLPREFAKSSLFSLIRPLRLICEQPNIRILLVSKTEEAATRFTGAIKHQLESNPGLVHAYGPFVGPLWTERKFTVLRDQAFKEPTVQAVGRGGQIVSGRYDVVILDDVEDADSTATEAARRKTLEWFLRDVVPVVVPGGHLYVVQTPQHPDDLVGQLQRQGEMWHLVNRPAEIERIERSTGQLSRESQWPEKWPVFWTNCDVQQAEREDAPDMQLARLARHTCARRPVYRRSTATPDGIGCLTGKRFEIGSHYYRLQYLVDATAGGGDFFKPTHWRSYTREQVHWHRDRGRWVYYDLPPGHPPGAVIPREVPAYPIEVYIGVDPAIADENERTADGRRSHFALVVLGYVRKLGYQLILHAEHGRYDFATQQDRIIAQAKAWHPVQIGIEEVAYQSALCQALARDPHLRIRPLRPDQDKLQRIAALAPDSEAGRVFLRAEVDPQTQQVQLVSSDFQRQAEGFPKATQRDLLDAWAYAVRLARERKMLAGYGETHPGAPGPPPQWTQDGFMRTARQAQNPWTGADYRRWARPW